MLINKTKREINDLTLSFMKYLQGLFIRHNIKYGYMQHNLSRLNKRIPHPWEILPLLLLYTVSGLSQLQSVTIKF